MELKSSTNQKGINSSDIGAVNENVAVWDAITKHYFNPFDYRLIHNYKHSMHHTQGRRRVSECDSRLLIDYYTSKYISNEKRLEEKLGKDDDLKKFTVIADYLLKLKPWFMKEIKMYATEHYTYGFFGNKCLNTICNKIDTAISNYCKNKQRKDEIEKTNEKFIANVMFDGKQIMKGFWDSDRYWHRELYTQYNLDKISHNEDDFLKSVITNKKQKYEINEYYSNGYLIVQRLKLIISIDMLCIFHSYKKDTKKVQKYIDLKEKYLRLIDSYVKNPNSLTCPEEPGGFIANLKHRYSKLRIGKTVGGKKLTKPKVKKLTKPKVEKPTKPKVKKPTKPKVKKPTKPKVEKPTKPKVKKLV